MDKVLVAGCGKYQTSGIKKLKNMGYYVIGLDGNPDAVGKKFTDKFYKVDIKNPDKVINFIKSKEIDIKYCISFATEVALRTVGKVNTKLGLPGPKLDNILISTNKKLQRDILKKNSIPHPKYKIFENSKNIKQKLKKSNLDFPLVIKPTDSSGSRGVFLINNINELNEKFVKSKNASNYDSKVIAEEFIQGLEYTVESLVVSGQISTLAISEKKKPVNNFTVSTELFYNSPRVNKYKDKIESTINEFISLCGFDNTIVHSELIYSYKYNKIFIIESSMRSGGFHIFDKILPKITDLDIVKLVINAKMEKNVKFDKVLNRPCIIRFFYDNMGEINKITKIDKIIDKVNNIELGFFLEKGDIVKSLSTDGSRLGYVISHGKSWEDVFHKANLIEYAINFEIVNH